MTDLSGRRLGHVPALNGLRGAAILAVIGYHYFQWPSGGFYGVDLFFALSGFLITTLLLEEHDRSGRISLRGFYARRSRRLLPALLALLAVLALLVVPGRPMWGIVQLAAGGLYAGNFVIAYHYSFVQVPLGQCWSLAEEEQFYLVWPLLLVVLLPRMREARLVRWLAAAFLVLAAYRIGLGLTGTKLGVTYYRPDTHADGLILGCVLALLRRRGLHVPAVAGWISVAAFAAVVAYRPANYGAAAFDYGLAPVSLGCVLMVGAALGRGWFSRALSFRPLVWVGEVSYSLYLWHLFVSWFVWKAFGRFYYGHVSEHVVLAAVLPVTFAVAALSYYKVEKRFRRPRRRTAAYGLLNPPTATGVQSL